ncbi:MAG: hypothetical protein DWQ29_15100 [Planctomycetota bacterium]|nr:MAG: hypothetical protein DWQ29_15100 [Planctomycetota bacterium]
MIAQFVLRLATGLGLTWCIMPRSEVTAGFFRIQMLLVLGLCVLAALTVPADVEGSQDAAVLGTPRLRWLCGTAAACAYAGSVFWMLARRGAGTVLGAIVALLTAIALIGLLPWNTSEIARAPGWLTVLSELSAAWLIGGATCAMLLGHWHLTATQMSLTPLLRLNLYLGAAAVVRGCLAGLSLLMIPALPADRTQLIWLILRWSAGIAGPLLMSLLVVRILRYRNTQSATGVLFAGVILAFIGETAAALLSRELGWPL